MSQFQEQLGASSTHKEAARQRRPAELPFSSLLAPMVRTRPRGRHKTLVRLLAATGIISVLLLGVSLLAAGRATRAFQDVNLSGSLRYRSLWVCGASQPPGLSQSADTSWPGQVARMAEIRDHLRPAYPEAVAATDPAWSAFSGSLRRTGHVDWRTANALRNAADALTRRIAARASQQNNAASLLLCLGLGGLLGALTVSGFLLAGLREQEAEVQRSLAVFQESQELFLQSINAMQEGYMVLDRAGRVLLCNAGAELLLGAREGLIGHAALRPEWRFRRENGDALPPMHLPSHLALQTGQPQDASVVGIQRSPDSTETGWFSVAAAPVFHAGQPHPYAVVLTFSDITAKKQAEEALQREREFQEALLESLQSGIVACDADGTLALFNRAAREFHGLPAEAVPAEQWAEQFDLYQPDGVTPLVTEEIPLFRAFSGEIVRDAEMVIAPKDGSPRILLASGQPIYSSGNRKIGAVVAMHDITARRQTEQELSRLAAIVESSEESILATTLDGTLVSWNAGAERLYGLSQAEVIGRHASVLAPEGEASPVDSVIPRLLRGEAVAPLEVVRIRPDGTTLNAALSFSPINDMSGRMIGLSCISRDVTARRQAEDALRESESRLRYLSGAAFEGIAVSRNGVIVDANPAFAALYGYEATEQLLGVSGDSFAAPASREVVRQKIADGDENAYEALCLRRDGTTFPAEVRGRSVLWDGLPSRVTAVRDITERKAVEEALRHSEQALRALMSSAPIILYAAGLDGIITLSEGTGLTSLGLAPGQAVGMSVFDFTGNDPVIRDNIRRAMTGETVSYDTRYGSFCLHVELRPQSDSDGKITGIIGVSFDITERARSEERFRVLFEQSSDAHVLFDDAGIIDCNPAALAMMRCSDKAHLLGIHPARLSPERQPDGRLSAEKGDEMCRLARQNGSHHFEWLRLALDGTEVPVEVTLTEVMLSEKPGLLSVWHDLTERKRAEQQINDYMVILEFQKKQLEDTNRELESLATTDGLTGLKNRRTFEAKLAEEHARAVRYHQPLSLLLLDVDQFKQYNDSFGHPAGDAVLAGVASVLTSSARDTDIAARYGGEEFVVILPQTDEAGARVIAERIRAVVAGAVWQKRPVTVSIGISTLSLGTPTPQVMTDCADKALYHSKETGRNRVTHGNPAAPPISAAPPPIRAHCPRPQTAGKG